MYVYFLADSLPPRSVRFTDHLYMRGRKRELPPLGIGRTIWPPRSPGPGAKLWTPGPAHHTARLGSAPCLRAPRGQGLPDII
jgi:hypothetical protein